MKTKLENANSLSDLQLKFPIKIINTIIDIQNKLEFTMGDIRSNVSSNHVKRVTIFSEHLGKKINLEKNQIKLLNYACPLHDIGKIVVPNSILNKPGKLSKEEFDIIKTHTTLGYGILKNSNKTVYKAAAIIAHQHHERWDGKGYPNNLHKNNIHIFGRISAIADVFDALSSHRVYKDAWTFNEIFDFFKEGRNTHFDPFLTDVFLDNYDEFVLLRNTSL